MSGSVTIPQGISWARPIPSDAERDAIQAMALFLGRNDDDDADRSVSTTGDSPDQGGESESPETNDSSDNELVIDDPALDSLSSEEATATSSHEPPPPVIAVSNRIPDTPTVGSVGGHFYTDRRQFEEARQRATREPFRSRIDMTTLSPGLMDRVLTKYAIPGRVPVVHTMTPGMPSGVTPSQEPIPSVEETAPTPVMPSVPIAQGNDPPTRTIKFPSSDYEKDVQIHLMVVLYNSRTSHSNDSDGDSVVHHQFTINTKDVELVETVREWIVARWFPVRFQNYKLVSLRHMRSDTEAGELILESDSFVNVRAYEKHASVDSNIRWILYATTSITDVEIARIMEREARGLNLTRYKPIVFPIVESDPTSKLAVVTEIVEHVWRVSGPPSDPSRKIPERIEGIRRLMGPYSFDMVANPKTFLPGSTVLAIYWERSIDFLTTRYRKTLPELVRQHMRQKTFVGDLFRISPEPHWTLRTDRHNSEWPEEQISTFKIYNASV